METFLRWVAGPVHLIFTSQHCVPIFEKVAFGYSLTLRISAEESEGDKMDCVCRMHDRYYKSLRKFKSEICFIFSALIRCTNRVPDKQMRFNCPDALYIVLRSATRFGYSCGHLQGDFCDNKNTNAIKTCLSHSTVLKNHTA